MILHVVIVHVILCFFAGVYATTYDQATSRANTLLDDADDIQRQLDNEARDRIKFGRPKTIWVFHMPTQLPDITFVDTVTRPMRGLDLGKCVKGIKHRVFPLGLHTTPKKEIKCCDNKASFKKIKHKSVIEEVISEKDIGNWSYKDQNEWYKTYPECGGRSQSPVDLPFETLTKTKGARKLVFHNYNVPPSYLTVENDGRTLTLRGQWKQSRQPYIYGGAAHSRRYIFHSMSFHWPSEHQVGGMQYPMESQALHMSADYKSMQEALDASTRDPLAFLGVANLYKFGNHTHDGLRELLKVASHERHSRCSIPTKPLSFFNPQFKEYACYQGSLTVPPCKEAVLWLVRGKALSVTREAMDFAEKLADATLSPAKPFRTIQPLNDRRTFFFRN